MAIPAAHPVITRRIHRLVVRIMARSTPHPALAFPGACTERQLFHMADHFQPGGVLRRLADVYGEHLFEFLPRAELPDHSARIRDSRFTGQVALLTNAVAGALAQF